MRSWRVVVSVVGVLALLAGCGGGGGGGGAGQGTGPGTGTVSGSGAGGGSGSGTAGVDPLFQKALDFSRDAQRDHTPDGLILDWNPRVGSFSAYADGGIWTGTYIAAEALRFATTGDPDAERNLTRSLRAFHVLQEITGEPGLYARSFSSRDPASILGTNGVDVTTGPYAGYAFKGDASKDQYIGIFFGYGVSWPFVRDPALRQQIRDDVARCADKLIADDLSIRQGGRETTFGDLYPEVYGLPVNAFNATLALAILKTAAQITQEPRHADAYEHFAIRRGYAAMVRTLLVLEAGPYRNYNNYNMAMLAFYLLLGLETQPALVDCYQHAMSRIFADVRGEQIALFDLIYAARRAGGASPSVVEDALSALRLFPYPNENRRVDLSNDPRFPHHPIRDRKGNLQTFDAIPFELREPDNFVWKINPRRLVGGDDNGEIFPGQAYLIAYWIGRHHRLF